MGDQQMTGAGASVLPRGFADTAAIDDFMTRPEAALIADLKAVDGDILVLGAGGKMGPTLARLAKRAAPAKRVVAVARFTEPGVREALVAADVETIACDLLDADAVAALPRLANVILMAGRKFGSTGAEHLTWATNAILPAMVAEAFSESRLVALSTGCVYPFVDVAGPAADEATPPGPPPGEYAWSCVARERLLEHASRRHSTAGRLIRLNYAIDMRYGVLHDLARAVFSGAPIDLATCHVNVIWQGDANARILRALAHCTTPTTPLNVTGPETVSIRGLAARFGRLLGRTPVLRGSEAATAWLSDSTAAAALFGHPVVPLARMIEWTADWVAGGGASLDRPTHFEARDGKF